LQSATNSEHAWLKTNSLVIPETKREEVIDLIVKGDRLQMANPLFRQELARWIRSGNSPKHDGIPAYAQGMNSKLDALAPLIAWAVKSFNLGKSQSVKDSKLVAQAPMLMLLSSDRDTPQDWLATGEALQHLLLTARVNNIWASFFNQPIEIPELRCQLKALCADMGYPQILLRFGYAREVKPTPRRFVEQVLRS
jgi:hypothetical protein